MTFFIITKVNVVALLVLEVIYYNIAVQYVNNYATGTTQFFLCNVPILILKTNQREARFLFVQIALRNTVYIIDHK